MSKILTIIFFLLIANTASANGAPADTMSVTTILQKTQAMYTQLPTYVDSGKVELQRYQTKYESAGTYFFKTAYQKTGQFALEYYEDGKENSIYTYTRLADSLVRTWYASTNKIIDYKSLVWVLRDTEHVFPRRSVLIPGLLLKEFYGKDNILNTIKNPLLMGSDLVDGIDCYKITGDRLDSEKITVWIEKDKLFILKVETDGPFIDYRVRQSIRIYPSVPQKIDRSLFAFRPNRYIDIYAGFRHRLIYSRFGVLTGLMLIGGIIYLVRRRLKSC